MPKVLRCCRCTSTLLRLHAVEIDDTGLVGEISIQCADCGKWEAGNLSTALHNFAYSGPNERPAEGEAAGEAAP